MSNEKGTAFEPLSEETFELLRHIFGTDDMIERNLPVDKESLARAYQEFCNAWQWKNLGTVKVS